MPNEPIELQHEVARAFKDLRAYHATRNKDKRTQIAARQAPNDAMPTDVYVFHVACSNAAAPAYNAGMR